MGLFLNERELLPQPLLYLSAYFERTRDDYYDGLFRVSTDGDWDGWIRYVLAGVRVQADAAIVLADRLQELNGQYRERLLAANATSNALALADYVFISPYITIRMVRERMGVTHPTARAAIRALEEQGILNERDPGRKWGKVFTADEVYALISGGESAADEASRV
jgi:Fic family protein